MQTLQVTVNGGSPINWSEFVQVNGLNDRDACEIHAALLGEGYYTGGGGAAAEFTVEVIPAEASFYTVAIYLEDRTYGGPEEGGWYYDCGRRVDDRNEHGEGSIPAVAFSRAEAALIALAANERLATGANSHRRSDTGSVLSEGRYVARVCEGYPEPHFPETTPHYE